eukprot:m.38441 g.38441  ORF g.38441 m.38441 type:complete len:450 (-) comp11183_c0_seq1:68-1417(-)
MSLRKQFVSCALCAQPAHRHHSGIGILCHISPPANSQPFFFVFCVCDRVAPAMAVTPTKSTPARRPYYLRSEEKGKRKILRAFLDEFWSGKDWAAPPVSPTRWAHELGGVTHVLPIHKREGGAPVVFLLNTPTTILVLKAPSPAMSEFGGEAYAAMLASKLGLLSPATSIFHKTKTEEIASLVAEVQAGKKFKAKAEEDNAQLRSALSSSFPYVFLMELLNGVPLNDVELTELPDTLITELMRQIGQILAFDLWINNTDRLPCNGVWEHNGNFANLMYNRSKQTMMVIDQLTMVLPVKARAEAYCEKVRTFLSAITQEALDQHAGAGVLQNTVNGLESACNVKLLQEDFQALRHGIIEMAVKISSLPDGIISLWRSKDLSDMAKSKAQREDSIRALASGWGKLAVDTDKFLKMVKNTAFRPCCNDMLVAAADPESCLVLKYSPASAELD